MPKGKGKKAPRKKAAGRRTKKPDTMLTLTGQQTQIVTQLLAGLSGATMPGRMGVAITLILGKLQPIADATAANLGEKMVEYGGTVEGIGPEQKRYAEFLEDDEVKAVLEDEHEVDLPKRILADDCATVHASGSTWSVLTQLGIIVA